MNSRLDSETALVLAIGGGVTYVAFERPPLGAAMLVGIAAVTLLLLMMRNR
ncbi:hypothetical protein [Streptomyces luteocolor]|uniref:hypothetical protein n=1 Tax=Streptomyces luteocolor TaxID=285500 RepID=UPI001873DC39|nr:hypothetical protein [Streptomyces luteocolor]